MVCDRVNCPLKLVHGGIVELKPGSAAKKLRRRALTNHYSFKLWQFKEAQRRLAASPEISLEKEIELAEYLSQLSGYLIGLQQAALYLGFGRSMQQELFALEDSVGIDLGTYYLGKVGDEANEDHRKAWEKWLWGATPPPPDEEPEEIKSA